MFSIRVHLWLTLFQHPAKLNRCHHFRGFVYQHACFGPDHKSIEIAVRPRKGPVAVCSRCHHPAPGYDQLPERRYEFIPLWDFWSS
jgi:hypothetical protein